MPRKPCMESAWKVPEIKTPQILACYMHVNVTGLMHGNCMVLPITGHSMTMHDKFTPEIVSDACNRCIFLSRDCT